MPTVFVPAQLRELTNKESRIEVTARTVGEAIAALDARFPGIKQRLCTAEELSPALQVSVDDVITSKGLLAQVQPDSEIHFLPAVGGG